MNWSTMKKVSYAFGIFVLIVSGLVYGFRQQLFPNPTCNDNKQNGYEAGVDCGGLCARKCVNEVLPISVIWANTFLVSNGVYDIAAMLTNKNSDSAPISLSADVLVQDSFGRPLFQKKIVVIPFAEVEMPIIIPNVALQGIPAKVIVTLHEGVSYKLDSITKTTQISIVRTRFENGDIPRLYATVKNVTRTPRTTVPISAVLYDETHTPIATGQTFVERLEKDQEQIVVFTWKHRFPSPPALIRVFPALSAFSM